MAGYLLVSKMHTDLNLQYSTHFGGNNISSISTLDQINALSDERQQLWRKAGQNKFSDQWWGQHDRIIAIGKQLDQLWHIHRLELAGTRQQHVTRVQKGLFSDYTDPQRLGDKLLDEGDLVGFSIEKPLLLSDPPEKESFPLVYCNPLFVVLSAQVLREVLVELKAEDRKRQRRKQHNMTLRQLRAQQRQRILP